MGPASEERVCLAQCQQDHSRYDNEKNAKSDHAVSNNCITSHNSETTHLIGFLQHLNKPPRPSPPKFSAPTRLRSEHPRYGHAGGLRLSWVRLNPNDQHLFEPIDNWSYFGLLSGIKRANDSSNHSLAMHS
jgi:hypothetical protein